MVYINSIAEKGMIDMKNLGSTESVDIIHKIEILEKEIGDLKLSVLKRFIPAKKKVIKLKGVLKGVSITETDIASAKRALYSKVGV
jgi:hypothetical protein